MIVAYTKRDSDMILSTLDKGLHVLEALAGAADGLNLTDLSHAVGMHRTTLFRILATLQARGFVQRDRDTDRYRVGMKLLSLSAELLRTLDIRAVARPILAALCQETRELVHLTVLDDGTVVTIERMEGHQTISLRTEIGERRPAYCTASGKAILAFSPSEETERILAMGMPAVTPRTITTREAMTQHLAEVRRRGFAWDDEERLEDVRCVAAPVFDWEGRVIAAVSVAMPSLRTPWSQLWQVGEMVRAAGDAISRCLGYTGPALIPAGVESENA